MCDNSFNDPGRSLSERRSKNINQRHIDVCALDESDNFGCSKDRHSRQRHDVPEHR